MASTTILHIDMDAFFASVEQLDDPALRGRCVVVGGSHRGVVAAASYEARKFGIHSAMPMFQALRRCPHLIVVAPRRWRYSELSRQIMDILRSFSPLVEPISIDEAYMDIGGCQRLHGTPRETALAIKNRIHSQTGLTCSVGIAPNKFIAKIASDMHKPDGLTEITPNQVASFIDALPVGKVPGVGRHALQILNDCGIYTLGQVRQFSIDHLVRRMGKFGYRLAALARGRDDSPVIPESEAKSISSETTLAQDTRDRDTLAGHLLEHAGKVAHQLRRHDMRARTVTLILKTSDFRRHTRSQTLARPAQASEAIYQTAISLLNDFVLNQDVRLIGVGTGGLQPASQPVQQPLFPESHGHSGLRWEKVDRAIDAIAERYGERTIRRGTLAGDNGED